MGAVKGRGFCCRASLTLRLYDSAWKRGFLTVFETFRRHNYIGPGQRSRIDKGSFTYLSLSSKVRDRVSRQILVAQVQAIHLIPCNNIFKAV